MQSKSEMPLSCGMSNIDLNGNNRFAPLKKQGTEEVIGRDAINDSVNPAS